MFASKYSKIKLRIMLIFFLLFSGLFYGLITFGAEQHLLELFLQSTNSYIMTLFLVAALLFFLPVFIASQTIPLLTELIPEQSKGKAAGSMLFASTIGSFLGSILTSIRLFEWLGVTRTAILVSGLLLLASCLLIWKIDKLISLLLVVASCCFIGRLRLHRVGVSLEGVIYQFDSAYQEILIRQATRNGEPVKIFHTNRAFSSALLTQKKESPFDYLREVMRISETKQPKTVLVIGTAGFTYPYELLKFPWIERIDTVDIDPAVKEIAEKHFLDTTLPDTVVFYPQSARYFVHQAVKEKKTYDLILVDAYNGKTIPDELTTIEFFQELAQINNPDGLVFNFILDTDLQTDLAKNILSSLSYAVGSLWTQNTTHNPSRTLDNFIVTTTPYDTTYLAYTPN
ncbi:MAG: fused MFS/spermidine synthase [bacterium]|nr:fused MFS/spermidine synthase [bacterium]